MTQAWHEQTALALGRGIATGDIDPVDLADHFLDRIAAQDPDHQIFVRLTADRARAEAAAARDRAGAGRRIGPLDGVPISWKDLYDSHGVATEGGSRLLAGRTPERDAVLLARASRAGLICLGKTSLPDFAYSGLGINPACGTPANAHDRNEPRIPGGSSAGAAVSVARGLAAAGIGSDTGGSVRIPASLNGLVGLKTTAGLLPLDGVLPLAPELDTAGPLCQDVADTNALFAVLAARAPFDLAGATVRGLRLIEPGNAVWDKCAPEVADCVRAALHRLATAGAEIREAEIPEFDAMADLIRTLGHPITLAGYAYWREVIESDPDKVFPPILERFRHANERTAVDAETLRLEIPRLRQSYLARTAGAQAVILPTVPIVAPTLAEMAADDVAHAKAMGAVSWNTRLGNLLGLCGLTLPCGEAAGLPVGLMLLAAPNREGALLRYGRAIERALGD